MTVALSMPRPIIAPRLGHVLSIADLGPGLVEEVLDDAAALKASPRFAGTPQPLAGRSVALLFQKPSLRTRVSFEVGLARLGATPVVLGGAEIGFADREPLEDIARTLSRYVDGIVARLLRHEDLERIAAVATVPVVNALTDREHPCQALADVLTLREQLGSLAGAEVAWVGDGNNVAQSLILAAACVGLHLRVATPVGYEPAEAIVDAALAIAVETGARLTLGHDPAAAVSGAAAVCTDVWTSMGQEAEAAVRRSAFAGFTVSAELLRAAPDAVVLHCLPAHRGQEIDADVIDGPASVVFDQAENRLWVQEALMLRLIGGPHAGRGASRIVTQLPLPNVRSSGAD
jgi:ornithine carbamoyltransferase